MLEIISWLRCTSRKCNDTIRLTQPRNGGYFWNIPIGNVAIETSRPTKGFKHVHDITRLPIGYIAIEGTSIQKQMFHGRDAWGIPSGQTVIKVRGEWITIVRIEDVTQIG